MSCIKIGTRGSRLAVRQAEIVKEALQKTNPDIKAELVIIQTKGDKILNRSLDKIGGKGVFVKEIEKALHNGVIDMAVHSLKDVPEEMPQGLIIGAILPRENPMDALITKSGCNFYDLPHNARVATGSLRRKVQLLSLRPDLQIVPIRGNIDSRIRKLDEGYENIDALVLAAAGLIRNNLVERISHYFTLKEMVPACCQGILAVETRSNDANLLKLLHSINDTNAEVVQMAERAFLKGVGADCHAPAGALATEENGIINITAMFYDEQIFIENGTCTTSEAQMMGQALANRILCKCIN